MPFSFPIGYRETTCYLVPVRAALIPFLAGALRIYEAREAWQTEADYNAAYNAFAELEASLMKNCIDELVESNRQIYRLVDSAFYGRTYTVVDSDPLVVAPSIPAVPDATLGGIPGTLSRLKRINELLENALLGYQFDDLPTRAGMIAMLEIIISELQVPDATLDDEMLAKLAEIAGLLA